MKCNRENDRPGQDRHEWADQYECPDDQQREQSKPDHQLDDILSGEKLAKRPHDRTPVWSMAERSSRVCAVILIQIKQRQMEAQSARSGIKAWLPRRSAVALKLQAQTIPVRWVILHVVVNAM